jgi:hypothetical protein
MSRNQIKAPTALANSMKRNRSTQVTNQSAQEPVSPLELTPEEKAVKKHRRCPQCWNNPDYRGKAHRIKWRRQINGPLHHRCYLCDACGTEWIVEFREEVDDSDITIVTNKVIKIRPSDEGQNAKEEMRKTDEPDQTSVSERAGESG